MGEVVRAEGHTLVTGYGLRVTSGQPGGCARRPIHMAAFDDLELDRSHDTAPDHPRKQSRVAAAAVLVALVAAVVLGWTWWARSSRHAPAAPAARPVTSVPTPPPATARELPPLDGLDPVVRELINGLTTSPLLAGWLGTTNLARQLAALVGGAGGAQVPLRWLAPLRPGGAFEVERRQGRTVIAATTYGRATPLVDVIAGLDAAAVARVYRTLSPRLEDAYAELAEDDRTFDVALREALDQLVATPVGDRAPEVVGRGGMYFFADPKLEALTPAQKLLLRTGPDNARKLQAQLRAIRAQLDGSPAS